MPVRWKLLGLAGVAGVAATGTVVVRRRRTQAEYEPDALRAKLHERLDATRGPDATRRSDATPGPDAPAAA